MQRLNSLKRMPQIQEGKARQRYVEPAQPCHCLEALAHFARHHELPRLIGETREMILIAACRKTHLLINL